MTQRNPSHGVRFIRASNAQGSSWPAGILAMGEDMIPGSGRLSLSMVDGRPAVAAISGSPLARLIYVRASNATGSSWFYSGAQNLAHPQINLGNSIRLLDVAGGPAILYDARFLRSTQLPSGSLHWMAVQP
jgi:hypothetical protein